MQLQDPSADAGAGAGEKSYDEIYVQSWEAALKECEKTLEQHDHDRALQVRTLADFRAELEKLMDEYPDSASRLAISLIYPTLEHYETFAQNFVKLMAQAVDVAMMWGLLFLVFKLALGEKDGEMSHLRGITKWLEKIGHKLRASNEGWDSITDFTKVKFDATEVNRELVVLWLNFIMTFRNQGQERGGWLSLDESAWAALTMHYNAAYQTIDEAVRRIERVAELTKKHASMLEFAQFQRLLSLGRLEKDAASLPCHTLPVPENKAFFGRAEILQKIEQHLNPADIDKRLSSLALYGLGGIGKTQIALAYAHSKLDSLDAVFWISSEDVLSVQQSFSRIAVNGLKLPNAHPGAHQENMILVLDWLQKTSAKWLVIFDNVDAHDVLDNCWPASKHGAVLVTTRDVLVATLPIDFGLEVNEFNVDEGAEFLIQMAPKRRTVAGESTAARDVAAELGGLPLALNQMAALVNARGCSIQDFNALYTKHQRRLHKERKSGWKYLGYEHALDTVWELSFTNLGEEARAILGVLSFFSADSVPADVFQPADSTLLAEILTFCEDELTYGDALEELTHHALVRKNIDQDTYRIHRLVQSEYLARMSNKQEEFEAAIKLLLDKFPSQRNSLFDDDEWLLFEKYVPQVLALARNYNDSQKKPNPLTPNMEFVHLLTNASNAVHDNDTANVVGGLLSTANDAFLACPEHSRDRLLWAFLQNLKCMYSLKTTDFVKAEEESRESLDIRIELLPPNDLLLHLGYSWLSMSIAAQGRYDEGLKLMMDARKILDGPAGDAPTRMMVWRYNTSRNLYCMGRFAEAEELLVPAVAEADGRQSWYNQVYGHLTMVSLRRRMGRVKDARSHVEVAKHVLETAGSNARSSWVSSQCAFNVGCIAMLQNQVEEAIEQTEKAVAIGKLTNIPRGVLARCTHAYSEALKMDPSKQEEAEKQRLEARWLRSKLPNGGGDLDDESDLAFEMLVRMDQR